MCSIRTLSQPSVKIFPNLLSTFRETSSSHGADGVRHWKMLSKKEPHAPNKTFHLRSSDQTQLPVLLVPVRGKIGHLANPHATRQTAIDCCLDYVGRQERQ